MSGPIKTRFIMFLCNKLLRIKCPEFPAGTKYYDVVNGEAVIFIYSGAGKWILSR